MPSSANTTDIAEVTNVSSSRGTSPVSVVERRFRRDIASLPEVFSMIDGFLAACGADPAPSYAVRFAVEELFTNMVKYNPDGDPEITLTLESSTASVVVRLTDCGGQLFDMTLAPESDTDAPLEGRKVGGLGIQLVRHMVDGFRYVRAGRCGTTIVEKNLE